LLSADDVMVMNLGVPQLFFFIRGRVLASQRKRAHRSVDRSAPILHLGVCKRIDGGPPEFVDANIEPVLIPFLHTSTNAAIASSCLLPTPAKIPAAGSTLECDGSPFRYSSPSPRTNCDQCAPSCANSSATARRALLAAARSLHARAALSPSPDRLQTFHAPREKRARRQISPQDRGRVRASIACAIR